MSFCCGHDQRRSFDIEARVLVLWETRLRSASEAFRSLARQAGAVFGTAKGGLAKPGRVALVIAKNSRKKNAYEGSMMQGLMRGFVLANAARCADLTMLAMHVGKRSRRSETPHFESEVPR